MMDRPLAASRERADGLPRRTVDDGARKRVSWRRVAALAALLVLVLVPTAAHAAAKPAGTSVRADGRAPLPHRRGAARPLRPSAGRGRAARRGAARRAPARRDVPRRGRPGPGLGRRVRARRAGVRRRLPEHRPRLHARRGRQPRHRAIGTAALPDAEPGAPGRPGRRRGLREAPRRAARLLRHRRPRRGSRGGAQGARVPVDRAVRRLVRHEARALVRARTSRPRRAAAARLGLAPRGRQPLPHRLLLALPAHTGAVLRGRRAAAA